MTSTFLSGVIKFGPFEVTEQVFLRSKSSFGLVNLKPLIPGHVLICPLTPHKRLTDIPPSELTDLFTTVQQAQHLLARVYFPSPSVTAGSFTIAVQDGADAGQTVPHVHVHVIPRVKGDLESSDEVYVKMASEEGNVGGALWDRGVEGARPVARGEMPRVEDGDRRARSMEEMGEEAERYREVLREMGVAWEGES